MALLLFPSVPLFYMALLLFPSVTLVLYGTAVVSVCSTVLYGTAVVSICDTTWGLLQEMSGIEEKMEYQLDERARDLQEALENCQTRVGLSYNVQQVK